MDGSGKALMLTGVLMVVILALGVLLLLARRWYASCFKQSEQENFTVENLEQMRESGHISRAEFSRLRRAALGLDTGEEKDKCESRVPEKLDDGDKDNLNG
ncbi:MAG: hypothetical protein ACYSTL_04745 [Planctomycetota bacterium]|jgi:hypothetical protein